MNNKGNKGKKRLKVRDFHPVSRKIAHEEKERDVTIPTNKPRQDKLWATLRESVNLARGR